MPEIRRNIINDCADRLSLTVSELMLIASIAPRRYFVWHVAKRSGDGKRMLCHPARELKSIQYYFLNNVICNLPIHSAATAYVEGSSIKKNAAAHAHSRVILKLDFADFFNSIEVGNWRKFVITHFPTWTADEVEFSCRILFWGAGSQNPRCLGIGAPTSPLLSNALMYDVDLKLQAFAHQSELTYTRYADDITFSSVKTLNQELTVSAVSMALQHAEYTNIRLNTKKTILVSNKSSRRVTGLVITPDHRISLGREKKRLLKAMVHHAYLGKLSADNWTRLSGLLAFASDAEPSFVVSLRRKYSSGLIDLIFKHGNPERPG